MNTNTYQIKQYRDGSYVKTINPDIIKSDVRFTANQNGGQGEFRITISESFEDSDYNYNDIIKVYLFNQYNPSGYLIYTGFIQEISQQATNSEMTEISCIGLVGLLSGIYYRSSTNRTFNKTDTVVNILTEILANFSTDSGVTITLGDTITTPTINVDFDYTYCIDAIKKVMEFIDGYWYVDQNAQLHIREHELKQKLTYKKNIQALDIRGDIQIYNRLILFYDGGNATYNDTTSQTNHGIRERRITDTSIKDIGSANEYGARFLLDNANPNKKTRLTVIDKFVGSGDLYILYDTHILYDTEILYDYQRGSTEVIEPGDGIRINNFYEVITGNIDRLTYNNGFLTIDLDKSENFIQLIKE